MRSWRCGSPAGGYPGISQRKIAQVTEKLDAVRIGKDAVSRIAQRLETELSGFRERKLEQGYPYLYLICTWMLPT